MPLIPKKVKFRKRQKGTLKGISSRGTELHHGEYGLKAVEPGWITTQQMEAARLAIARTIRRGGRIFLRIATDKSVTKKPLETRMGKGKGEVEVWVSPVKPGRVILEIEGVPQSMACRALRIASEKLPIKVKIISRIHTGI
ncbi:MAG TPA: 50S ribosomal protein L16 [Candidatus Omnitrophica bacterium]|nr:50S ribosomal protein L16 [Candidatus Omnitrophota bacterium]